jgi:sugar lactone lactonase YvrE
MKWKTEKVMKTPESVIYDAEREAIYVSNINRDPESKDRNGFISKLNLKGEIEELKWVKDLNGPKGSAIINNRLYVADVDHVVEIDIEKGMILNRYQAEGAKFLNDVTADKEGSVYISDSSGKNSVIYRLSEGKISVWLKSDQIKSPNGLLAKDDKLIVGASGNQALKAVDLSDKSITTIANIGSGIDGVVDDERGNYLLSDWSGKTSMLTPDGKLIELLNTTDEGINAADIEYIKEKSLLLIPTFSDNRVMAYKVEVAD